MEIYDYFFKCLMYIIMPMMWFWIGYVTGKAKVETIHIIAKNK